MNFVNTKFLPHVIVAFSVVFIIVIYFNFKYFKWIKDYWFYERTIINRLSQYFYLLSLFLMFIALLDLRGPEEKIKSNLPDQRTIIILDSSLSMLSEDVRPSRFVKALQMARHFVKNAAGHQVSIVLFSDIQKRLIPFTDDADLLDSRLAALEDTNAVSGGSNISQAIAEAISYFDFDGEQKMASGNVLVFTDAEESEGEFNLEIGDNVNLAIVGIGTVKGGNIPMRWEDGSFRGYKSAKGEQIITKLDENYIKKMGKKVKHFNYWIANSYSLPTDEILNFFRNIYKKSQNKGDLRVRPVYSHIILIPAILFYIMSVILGRFQSLKYVQLVGVFFFLIIGSDKIFAEDKVDKPKVIPKDIAKDMEEMKAGKKSRKEILKIAEKFLKNDDQEKALKLYNEYSKENDDFEINFNKATALIQSNNLSAALPIVQKILKGNYNEIDKDKMRNNLLLALNGESKKEKDKNKEDKDKEEENKNNKDEDKNKKDENKKDQDKGKSKEKNEDKNKESSEPDKSKDKSDEKQNGEQNKPSDKSEENEEDLEKEKKGKEPKDLDQPQKESKPKSIEEKEKDIQQKRMMVKTPAMIKQILSDDRELQKKLMDTSTKERANQKPKRDW